MQTDGTPGTTITGRGLVEAAEALNRRIFGLALLAATAAPLWAIANLPFDESTSSDRVRNICVGLVLAAIGLVGYSQREALRLKLRAQPVLLLGVVALAIAAIWIDDPVHPEFWLVSCTPIVLAAVLADTRWAFACAAVLVVANAIGVFVIHGETFDSLRAVNELDNQVERLGGYVAIAAFTALPAGWLAGTVARFYQLATDAQSQVAAGGTDAAPIRRRTKTLSVREVEICQLVVSGMSNDAIAGQLFLSPRTVQTHLTRSMRKTETSSRTELAVLAVREGLAPATED